MLFLWRLIVGLFRGAPPAGGAFDPEERRIYRYFTGTTPDGRKVFVQADPMDIWKKLSQVGTELDANIRVARSPSKFAPECYEKMIAQLRQVFGVKPLAEGGLTEPETIALFNHYMTFSGFVKKNTPTTPTSADAASTDTGSTSGGDSPTKNTSDSGSTESAPSPGPPPPSAPGSGSPSGG